MLWADSSGPAAVPDAGAAAPKPPALAPVDVVVAGAVDGARPPALAPCACVRAGACASTSDSASRPHSARADCMVANPRSAQPPVSPVACVTTNADATACAGT